MFNVSDLLLDDALKLATPLTNGAMNETLRQTLDISQGSETITLVFSLHSPLIAPTVCIFAMDFFDQSEILRHNDRKSPTFLAMSR